MSQADEYRQRAAVCQRQGDAAATPGARDTLRDIAKKYLKLAANEERAASMSAQEAAANGSAPPERRAP